MIRAIELENGERFFVEVEDQETSTDVTDQRAPPRSPSDLPSGSRETGAAPPKRPYPSGPAGILQSQLHSLAQLSLDALSDLDPQEICLEAHIKFAGDVKLIPFIASAKGDGGLKVRLTWKKAD